MVQETPEPLSAVADRLLHSAQGRFTGAVSLPSLWLAFADWGVHLANAPFRQLELAQSAAADGAKLVRAALGEAPFEASASDHRFSDPAWRQPPFNLIHQSFLAQERWWRRATTGVRGVEADSERVVAFTVRQWLDAFAPSNFAWSNPEVLHATVETGGANLVHGLENLLEDVAARAGGHMAGAGELRVGRDLAATPGEVVFRNDLIELIRYAPTTATVRPEPVLITPAWIMKYYILDLSRRNSLIRYLVDQGFTVFCISWRNPDASMRDTGFAEYLHAGFFAALHAVRGARPGSKVHVCGYCLGGTLAAIAAAAMGRDGDDRLASLTLFAAQTDFTEAGELQLFTSEGEVAFLEDVMWRQGYLDGSQMAAAFQLLRSNDLVWSRMLRTYLLGRRDLPSDLMTWNADVTRLPFRMHSESLRRLFLGNDLAEGRFPVEGRPIALEDVRPDVFVVATETDHVAPWRSVYKLHLLNPGRIDFVLTSGGHNAGIVSEPGHPGRHYRLGERPAGAGYVAPDDWLTSNAPREGSWWPAWTAWLAAHGGAPVPAKPTRSAGLGPAPGSYVLQP